MLWSSPLDMSAESLLAGMKLVAEGALVLFPLDGWISVMFLLVHSEVWFGGVALETDVTLERFFSGVYSGVTLIFAYKMRKKKSNDLDRDNCNCTIYRLQQQQKNAFILLLFVSITIKDYAKLLKVLFENAILLMGFGFFMISGLK